MKNLNDIYFDFVEKFKIILQFISENFGDNEILIRKNQGLIQSRNIEIKHAKIKGYIFHGTGCNFRFKKNSVDIEFRDNNIGFTDWAFYSYVKSLNPEITEENIKGYLEDKVNHKVLKHNGEIFEINA